MNIKQFKQQVEAYFLFEDTDQIFFSTPVEISYEVEGTENRPPRPTTGKAHGIYRYNDGTLTFLVGTTEINEDLVFDSCIADLLKSIKTAKCYRQVTVDWDTDGADAEELGLPKEVSVPAEIDPYDIDSWLSDQYGYCVNRMDWV